MLKRSIIAATLLVLCSAPAFAACPPETSGTTAEQIEANSRRMLCIQNELSNATQQRNIEFKINQLERSIQDLQIQRRVDAVPMFVPVTPIR